MLKQPFNKSWFISSREWVRCLHIVLSSRSHSTKLHVACLRTWPLIVGGDSESQWIKWSIIMCTHELWTDYVNFSCVLLVVCSCCNKLSSTAKPLFRLKCGIQVCLHNLLVWLEFQTLPKLAKLSHLLAFLRHRRRLAYRSKRSWPPYCPRWSRANAGQRNEERGRTFPRFSVTSGCRGRRGRRRWPTKW